MIDVQEWFNHDGQLNLTITWDKNDPVESKFNDWTSEDFLNAICNACEEDINTLGDEVRADGYSVMHITTEGERHLS